MKKLSKKDVLNKIKNNPGHRFDLYPDGVVCEHGNGNDNWYKTTPSLFKELCGNVGFGQQSHIFPNVYHEDYAE